MAYYGHQAQSAAEMQKDIKNHQLGSLLTTIKVKPGDLIYVPAGTLHALGAGIVALEIEQSSDNTLRFYDFARIDPVTGKQRPIQIDKAIAVTNFPNHIPDEKLIQPVVDFDNPAITSILRSPYFQISRIKVVGKTQITHQHYSINGN